VKKAKTTIYFMIGALTGWLCQTELSAGQCTWPGFTLDNGRGPSTYAIESTRAIVKFNGNFTSPTVPFAEWPYVSWDKDDNQASPAPGLNYTPSITMVVKRNGTIQSQSSASQDADYNNFTAPAPTSTSDPATVGNLPDSPLFDGTERPLVDYGRYRAAAMATGTTNSTTGNYYTNACYFKNTVLPANPTMYGIVYVEADYNTMTCKDSTHVLTLAGSLTLYGTLVIEMKNMPESVDTSIFTIKVQTNLKINPITGPSSSSTTLTSADYTAFKNQAIAGTFNPSGTSGTNPDPYEKAWMVTIAGQSAKDPVGKTLAGGYPKFTRDTNSDGIMDEDYPAFISKGGNIKFQKQVNINGLAYTTNDFEPDYVSNPTGLVMFFNGGLLAAGGVAFEDGCNAGGMFISFAPKTVDRLGTMIPKQIRRRGYTVVQ